MNLNRLFCSRCGKPITEFLIKLENTVKVYKVSDSGALLPYNNVEEPTTELLCSECFSRYAQCLDQLNKEYSGEFIANMVEVVDDIRYSDNYRPTEPS